MSEYREGCLKRKAVQAGIVDQRPVSGKKVKARPSIIECRTNNHAFAQLGSDGNQWRKWKAYRNGAEAQKAIAILSKKYPHHWEFRIKDNGEGI